MTRNGLTIPSAITINGYEKHYPRFTLGPLNLEIPQGFTTAIIGENGAGKSTLLDALGGITNGKDKILWLEKYKDLDQEGGIARNEIGWCAANRYFPMNWTIKNVIKSLSVAFDNFSPEKFEANCRLFGLGEEFDSNRPKKLSSYSDGNISRLAIASLLARDTKLMILDEPDASLDPVIRDTLNSKFREYISQGKGQKSILFSTHNIADMESLVDYVVFMAKGRVIAQGFVEDLREQYRYVHGPKALAEEALDQLDYFYCDKKDNMEALCKSEKAQAFEEKLAVEVPTLQQLAVLILRSAE